MCKLSFIVVLIVLTLTGYSQTSPHGTRLKTDCILCHTSETWKVSKSINSFDHNSTTFKLTGQHQATDCILCHKTLKFEDAKGECISCHTDMHLNTLGPNCVRCHDTQAWTIKSSLSMHKASRFPLEGSHAVVECSACHKSASNYQYEPLGVECVNCHQKDYLAAKNPNHQQSGYPSSCVECHAVNATSWNVTSFNHNSFPLTDGHNITCVECHKGGTYKKVAADCMSCHQVQFNAAKGHAASKFSADCKTCHNSANWLNPTFDHATTNFPLTGSHVSVDCASCHTTGYAGTSMECKTCHQTKYTATQKPNHTTAGISVECKTCHSTTAWQPSSFNHNTTGFVLTGAHADVVQCSSCHLGNTTSAKPDCISCHQVQYNGAKNHVASKFPTDCKMCHSSNNWISATFNHSLTKFPLTGAHITTECASCHTTGYVGTSMECKTCHQAKYTSAQTPNHTAAGISSDCKTCHTTSNWQPSSFKHSTTGFTLTGAHTAIVQCSSCHLGNTTSAKTDCYSCHKVQYDEAKDHVASKFPTDCVLCHNPTNWLQSTFNHATSNFPLTGAHITVDCAGCHANGYAGTSVECKSCHQAKYTATQTPNHTKAGISVECKTCHTTTAWQPSGFNHNTTGFALAGGHAAIVQCSSCHIGNTTSAKPDCISCHQVQYNGAKDHVASKFPTNCTMCHNSNNWLNPNFNHSLTNFPLTGAHISLECASCHTAGYVGTSMECKTCHQAKYTATQVPNHAKAGISNECKTCHTTTAWQPSSFNHNTTIFPLTGAHTSVVQCSSCHLGNTTSAKTDCMSCHQVQYNGAKGHVASKFPTDCKICHNSNNWLGATFNHSTTNFPLIGAHVSVDCASCHSTGYVGTSMECKSCHQAKYTATQTPNHTTAGISVECKTCHTTATWQPSSFNHSTTGFTLSGAHSAIVQCSSCHLGNTTSAKPDCISCHQAQYTGAKGHVDSKFPTDCKICHNSNNWLNPNFNHSLTNFPLTGVHLSVECASCHTNGYAGTSMECKTCHQAKYTATKTPNHTTAGISVECKTCHTTATWQPSSFNHSTTGFNLTGAHSAIVQCSSCHLGNTTSAKPDCITCHQAQYNGAKDHVASKFPTNCTLCHNSNNWLNPNFNHSLTNFPLTGAHLSVECASCHTIGYAGTSMECKSCHQAKYTATQTPNHTTAGISVECKICHTTTAWQPSSFNHNTTIFPLTGAHTAIVQCSSCHKGNTTSASAECKSCHQAKFTATQTPNHTTAGISVECKTCHTTKAWQPSSFNHNTTIFPLTGAHTAIVQCSSCHKGNTTSASTECKSCHQTSFTAALVPNHTAAGIAVECISCHTTTGWKPSVFNHAITGFALSGAHAAVVQCSSCHKGNTTSATPDCISCHQVQYNGAKDHVASKFPTDCKMCHNSNNWLNPNFNHSLTNFPLTGTHLSVECASCHIIGYAGTPMECKGCHQAKYTATLTPNHTTAGISVDCKTCHTTTAWQPSSFNHSTTIFPLTGAHTAIVQCSSCHKGNTTSASTECKGCHQAKYTATQTPNHTTAGISVDCKTCHTTTAWQPSSFKHSTTIFPLTGAHATIVQCSSCHKGNTTSASTECKGCHQAKYTATQTPNHTTAGISVDCKTCHTTAAWQPSLFKHSTTVFPLTGAHATIVQCSSCHKGNTTSASLECKGCHQTKYNAAVLPSHTAAGIAVDCITCHTTTGWKPSLFNHTSTGFALSGAHALVVQCSSCHKGNTTSATPDCISCHQVQYNGATGHVASKFPTDCKMCHTSNNWQNATFNHSLTRFALTGAHMSVDCATCHPTAFAGTSMECKSCHQTNYTAAIVPSHTAAGIAVDCITCHTTTGWKPSSFNHSTTIFPLTGAHTSIVQCSACHKGNTTSASPDCVTCHQANYNTALNHLAKKFPTDCKMCHNTTSFPQATFNHSSTIFPLTGFHTTVACASCHTNGYSGGTPTDCKSCHQTNYNAALVPSHIAAGISVDCKICHTTTGWKPSTFNHTTTGFALTGSHTAIVQCSSCHKGNTISAAPDCISCHQVQYNGAKNHVAFKFPTDCKMCHNTVNWLQTTFNHSTTIFPLTGAHVTVQCASCHTTGYAGTPTACNSCHTTDYNGATNPNHKTLGLSTTCTDCHTTLPGWAPAKFPNHSTYFALTGAHITVDCASCHKGVYSVIQKTCTSCHIAKATSAKNPPHVSSQFTVVDCASCHTTSVWVPSTFNHTPFFPIKSGKHTNISCVTCHTTPTNYVLFTCFTASCHTKTVTDGHHSGVRGYSYTSTACYSCHANGRVP